MDPTRPSRSGVKKKRHRSRRRGSRSQSGSDREGSSGGPTHSAMVNAIMNQVHNNPEQQQQRPNSDERGPSQFQTSRPRRVIYGIPQINEPVSYDAQSYGEPAGRPRLGYAEQRHDTFQRSVSQRPDNQRFGQHQSDGLSGYQQGAFHTSTYRYSEDDEQMRPPQRAPTFPGGANVLNMGSPPAMSPRRLIPPQSAEPPQPAARSRLDELREAAAEAWGRQVGDEMSRMIDGRASVSHQRGYTGYAPPHRDYGSPNSDEMRSRLNSPIPARSGAPSLNLTIPTPVITTVNSPVSPEEGRLRTFDRRVERPRRSDRLREMQDREEDDGESYRSRPEGKGKGKAKQ